MSKPSTLPFAAAPAPHRRCGTDAVDDASAIVEAIGLTKQYGSHCAVAGIDFHVDRGEVFGFLGPNGAGKTTTMRMIATVSAPTAGSLRVLGQDPISSGRMIRSRLGVVPQQDGLDPELTVLDNLVVFGRYFNLPRQEARRRALELLGFVQLRDRAADEVESLSGGMKRRLAVARSLMNDPEMLLLDEPTTGLDPQARHLVWDRLYALKQGGVGLVLTTHFMDEAERLCDRLVVMDRGRIIAAGSPCELVGRYVTREVVELRLAPGGSIGLSERLHGLGSGAEILAGKAIVYADDGEACAAEIFSRGIRAESVLVRRASLEDVFLRLTGRSLVD